MSLKNTLSQIVILLFLCTAQAAGGTEDYHPTRLIVKFHSPPKTLADYKSLAGGGTTEIAPLFSTSRNSLSQRRYDSPVYLFTYADESNRSEAESLLSADAAIAWVERDYKLQLFHDPLYENQWALHNEGQRYYSIMRVPGPRNDNLIRISGTAGADIDFPNDAVPMTERHRVILAITDTGVDYRHPDLAANIWHNEDEIPGNGIDDDFNGFADDYYGYDFSGDSQQLFDVLPDPDPADDVGHGTHVAGITAAVSGNRIGIEGIAHNVEVMCLKIFPNAYASVSAQAVIYAVENGAEIINASWGSPYYSSIIAEVVRFANDNNVLFVAAAGNSGDNTNFYPASLNGVITVGASTSSDYVTEFSTFGEWVDLIAPGQDILSLRAAGTDLYASLSEPEVRIIGDRYYLADGTSMAAPHVAGAAAFLLSVAPGLTADSLTNLMLQSSDDIVDPYGTGESFPGRDQFSGYGRLNLGRAVALLSGEYAEINQPQFNAIRSGGIAIVGSAYSSEGKSYQLEVKPASSDFWITLDVDAADVVNDTLIVWNSGDYDGRTAVRLTIGGGIVFQSEFRLLNNSHVAIDFPVAGDTVFSVTEVNGSASVPDFLWYDLSFYSDARPKEKNLIVYSNKLLFRSRLADWTTGRIVPGPGRLELVVKTTSELLKTSVPIVVKSRLTDGYPIGADTWPHLTAVVGNVDDDPFDEIVWGAHNHIIINHFDRDSLQLLETDFGTSYYSSISLHDSDSDGIDELVVVTDSGLTIMDCHGENLSGWPKYLTTGNHFNSLPTPLVTDIDGDSAMEVAFVNLSGEIFVFHADGSSYFHTTGGLFATIDTTGRERIFGGAATPYIFAWDFDHDGYRDIGVLYTSRGNDAGLYMYSGKNGQALYSDKGTKVLQTAKIFGGLLADFDSDGEPEIAFVHYDKDPPHPMAVSIVESDGTPLAGWPKVFSGKVQWLASFPAAADLDGDGVPELVATFSALDGGEVAVWKADGTPLLDNSQGTNSGVIASVDNSLSSPLILDVDNDGEMEIVSRAGALFFGKPERVFAFNLDGSTVKGWPVYTYATLVTYAPYVPAVGDFDNDGLLEMVMGSSHGRVYSWDLPTVVRDDAILWGSFLHDKHHSGILPFTPKEIDEVDPDIVEPAINVLLAAQNYPNPFNTNTVILLDVDRDDYLTVDIFNILGQQIVSLYRGFVVAGQHRFSWDGRDQRGRGVASGVYFYRVKLGEIVQTRKMLYLK